MRPSSLLLRVVVASLFAAACSRRTPPSDGQLTPSGTGTPPGSAGESPMPPAPPPKPTLSATDPDPPAGKAGAELPPPTLESAGGDDCTIAPPSDIDSIPSPRFPGVRKMPAAIVMGAHGGLLLWQGEDNAKAFARAIGKDGKPTSETKSFPIQGSVFVKEARAFDGGFAVIMSHFVVKTLETSYWLYVLGPDGSARGTPTELAMPGFLIEKASEMVADRFVVFVGPDQSKGTPRSRALLLRVDATGEVKQKVMDFEISAPIAVRPKVELALSPTHWAAIVDVGTGAPETITIGDKTYETKPLVKPDPNAKATHDVIIDGKKTRYPFDVDPRSLPRRIAWSGDTLAAITADNRVGRLEADGKLVADPKLKAAFADHIEADFVAGGGSGTTVTRRNSDGEVVGKPLRLDGALTGIGADGNELEQTWAGDRFLFAYALDQGGKKTARVVAVSCEKRGATPATSASTKPRAK